MGKETWAAGDVTSKLRCHSHPIQSTARVECILLSFVWGEPEAERPVTEDKSLNTSPGVWPIIILKPSSHHEPHTVRRVDVDVSAAPGQGTAAGPA